MSTGKQKFGPWLLEQVERQDAIGSMARAWKQLKEASGYNRVTTAKSIGQLLSARLGENWQQMQGDEVIAAAEKEWEHSSDGQPDRGILPAEQGTIFDLPPGADVYAAAPGKAGTTPQSVSAPQFAVLVVDGREFELTAGRRYIIDFGAPVVRDVEGFEQPQGATAAVAPVPSDGVDAGFPSWFDLYGRADHNVPDGVDLASLGLTEE